MTQTTNMSQSMENDQLSSGNMSILSKVDRLRELLGSTVGSKISLPQLVVVGDQSSGKSSVLENLTGFAFPRAAELCTRYATQITCRREPEQTITISIIPNADATSGEQARLRNFRRTCDELSPDTLAQLFKDANEVMGIRGSSSAATSDGSPLPAFSEHILKIEKTGPEEDHFTVIDVPGIFRQETEGVTTENDIELVKNMVKSYMKESRTIILAIIPSNVDPATQEILKLAKKADPSMTRTMAVLTKPDLAIEPAMQQIAIDHVLGKRGELTLGYYIVKNRGPSDVDMTLRDGQLKEKAFFANSPWSSLAHTGRAGVDCLKTRVRELLIDLIKKEFPKLKNDVIHELRSLRSQQDNMGPSRSDAHAQRAYLNRISEAFQSLVRDALSANYTGDNILSSRHELRLITRIVERNEDYAKEMTRNGHTRPFAKNKYGDEDRDDNDDEHLSNGISDRERQWDIIPTSEEFAEIRDIMSDGDLDFSQSHEHGDIMSYIESVHKASRGPELGTFGGSLLATLFKEQSQKWEPITLNHIGLTIYHVHVFISRSVKAVCLEPKVRDELWNGYLLDELLGSYRGAMDHAKFLLEIEREGPPVTVNHYFNDNLQKRQAEHLAEAMEKLGMRSTHDEKTGFFLQPSQLKNLAINKANATFVSEHMHNVLSSYYKVSIKRFVDVVCQQTVNYYLLSGKRSPLKIFNTDMVLNLNEEQLDMIAGEDALVKHRREKLNLEIGRLEEALKVLKGHR
ncbi:P-loop containing nucleoside triphosphate hydrolase protein [Xylaria palmicola]|nr:P-loop containing nucleoside triphosphate hydrolase protein [Xylaria palmicola]